MISYVLAAHNSTAIIEKTVERIVTKLQSLGESYEIIIVENGSTDDTYSKLQTMCTYDPCIVPMQSEQGLGNAFKFGILATNGDFVMATADDLPFGFSDLDNLLKLETRPSIAIGSKAHPHSQLERTPVRFLASSGLRVLRMLLLKLRVGDTQGTYLINGEVARKLAFKCSQPGYIFTTELSYLATLRGEEIVELPIILDSEIRPSTVRIVRDSISMLKGMIEIRRTHRRSSL